MGMTVQHRLGAMTAAAVMLTSAVSLRSEDVFEDEPPKIEVVGNRLVVRDASNSVHHVDHLVYGTTATYGQQQVESHLGNRVYELSVEYELTEAQQSKIKLAGRSEAKHFYFEVEGLRRQFDLAKGDSKRQQLVAEEAKTLNKRRSKLFGPDSFFMKVTSKTVTGDQRVKRQTVVKDRIRLRHRSNIEGAIRDIERQVVLTISQHEALVELLTTEIPPPSSVSNLDETLVKYRFAHLPEAKIKSLLNPDHWSSVRQVLDGFAAFGPALSEQGLIADTIVDGKQTDTPQD